MAITSTSDGWFRGHIMISASHLLYHHPNTNWFQVGTLAVFLTRQQLDFVPVHWSKSNRLRENLHLFDKVITGALDHLVLKERMCCTKQYKLSLADWVCVGHTRNSRSSSQMRFLMYSNEVLSTDQSVMLRLPVDIECKVLLSKGVYKLLARDRNALSSLNPHSWKQTNASN